MSQGRAAVIGMVLAVLAVVGVIVGPAIEWPWESPRDDGDLPSCGTVDLGPGTATSEVPADRAACLFDAAAERVGAELEVVSYTTEGDPIPVYYRHHPGVSGLEVMEDQTADSYGSGDWVVTQCPEATSPHALGVCTPRGS
ncbi:exported protein of unknown function [Modestobacter italicus]|uniref:Uncharacterized protein n=1 Tax=Modestobacter italicus (strain DSM 44449 / CECT 9708 / BC 501) TaxID=2732864 RepID=I4F0W6_MODI5|nr:hypothetical protein [Modestobacter marinus]CCH89279.1 exported protein of unknown function [Modestobacter marinus]